MASVDKSSCLTASRVGEICHTRKSRCISPFSGCLDTCRCYDAFVPSRDGRCRLATTNFVGEPCGSMGCEYPAKCISGTCTCKPPFRNMTEDEFWVDPLVTSQCEREDFSLWKCNGSWIDIPEDLRTTTEAITSTSSTTQTTSISSTTTPSTTVTSTTTTTSPMTTTTTPSTTITSTTTTTTPLTTVTSTTTTSPMTTTTSPMTTTTTTSPMTTTTSPMTTTSSTTTKIHTTTTTPAELFTPTMTSSITIATTTERLKSHVHETCSRHEDCPENSRCHPNACRGFVCVCIEGFLKSYDGSRCMPAAKIGETCIQQTTRCISPFASCTDVCKCYDLFVPSTDGRCKLRTSSFVGEICGEKGCEYPAKCYDGICQCVMPYREKTPEEYWIDPLDTSQCHKINFSLVKCEGKYIDVPGPLHDEWRDLLNAKRLQDIGNRALETTTTAVVTAQPEMSTVSTTLPWFRDGSDVRGYILNANPNSHRLYTSCSNHDQCPTNSKCRPKACDGFVCLCNKGYAPSPSHEYCLKAIKVGETCRQATDTCLSPFASCAGRCHCYNLFVPSDDGRCKLASASFVGEPCGGKIGCEYPATCEDGVCMCLKPHRSQTEDEKWIYPLQTNQCIDEKFSTMTCNGKLIDVPVDLLPEWRDFIQAYRSKFETTTLPVKPLLPTTSTKKHAVSTHTSPSSTRKTFRVEYKTKLEENCNTHAQCPTNSKCRPRSCDGYICICDRGFVPSTNRTVCLKAKRVGEICDPKVSKCISPFAACAERCWCYSPFLPTTDGRCKIKTANFIGEQCGETGCDYPSSCVKGVCKCRHPYRPKTSEEFWADPFDTAQCSRNMYSLRMCGGVKLKVPDGLQEDAFYTKDTSYWPDGDSLHGTENGTQSTDTEPDFDTPPWKLINSSSNSGPDSRKNGSFGWNGKRSDLETPQENPNKEWTSGSNSSESFNRSRSLLPDFWGFQNSGSGDEDKISRKIQQGKDSSTAGVMETCFTHGQCPDHSRCRPMACDGYKCVCDIGYVPSDDRTACLPAVLVGDTCDPINSNCLSPFAVCKGTCECYDVYEKSQDGRCRTKTAGFVGDPCGGNKGCEFPATCVDGECACVYPYRRLTKNEFWADVTRTRQCHQMDFALYKCDGKSVPIPYALRNETDQLHGSGMWERFGKSDGGETDSDNGPDVDSNGTVSDQNGAHFKWNGPNDISTNESDENFISRNKSSISQNDKDIDNSSIAWESGSKTLIDRHNNSENVSKTFGYEEASTMEDQTGSDGSRRPKGKSDLSKKIKEQDTVGLYFYVPQGGFYERPYPDIGATKTVQITLSDLLKDKRNLSEIFTSINNISKHINTSNSEDTVNSTDTRDQIHPSYSNPVAINTHSVDTTEKLGSDQVRGRILSTTLSVNPSAIYVQRTTFGPEMISRTRGDVESALIGRRSDLNNARSNQIADRSENDASSYVKTDHTDGTDNDANSTKEERPERENPGVNEADVSETVLLSGSISAVFLLNMICIALLIIHRRRQRKKDKKLKDQDRSTVSEYEIYQLSGPYITLPAGPCVPTATELSCSGNDDLLSETCVTSDDHESGYSTLPESSLESVVGKQEGLLNTLKIPRPLVTKGINDLSTNKDAKPVVTSRKRSKTMTYTTAKDNDIKYWFCDIPRPLVNFRRKSSWGTWPKTDINPYLESSAASTGSHTYEEILPTNSSEKSV